MIGLTESSVPDVKSTRFRMIDTAYIAMMILPILACIALKVLFTPASEGVNISGALVYWQSEEELGATLRKWLTFIILTMVHTMSSFALRRRV